MSRFADPTATETVDLPGACQCPGTPHEVDQATVRYQLGASALARIGHAQITGPLRGDPLAGYRQVAIEGVERWNLLDEDGDPVPVTAGLIAELDTETITFLAETIDRLVGERGSLPNGSGAPSAASPQGSASPIPKPRRKSGT